MEHGFAFVGENAYRTDEIISVKELVNKLTDEYNISEAADARPVQIKKEKKI